MNLSIRLNVFVDLLFLFFILANDNLAYSDFIAFVYRKSGLKKPVNLDQKDEWINIYVLKTIYVLVI